MGPTNSKNKTRLGRARPGILVLLILLLSGCVERPVTPPNPYDQLASSVNAVETNATAPPPPPPEPTSKWMAWRNFPVIKQIIDIFDVLVHGLFGDNAWLYVGAIVVILLFIFKAPTWAGVTIALLILIFFVRTYLTK